jgi:hypothetical protein
MSRSQENLRADSAILQSKAKFKIFILQVAGTTVIAAVTFFQQRIRLARLRQLRLFTGELANANPSQYRKNGGYNDGNDYMLILEH